jgi:hypothetical protein
LDRVTRSYVETFRGEQSLPDDIDKAVLFEHFVNYSTLTSLYDEEFDILDVHTGGGNDLTLDGVAIIVNGVLVTSVEEAQELVELNKYLTATFFFAQAKSASSFSGEQIAAFGDGVLEFFADTPRYPISDRVAELRGLMSWIYDNTARFKLGRPTCELRFVSTGTWVGDAQLQARVDKAVTDLRQTNLFELVDFHVLGAAELQEAWSRSKSVSRASFTFAKRTTLADIPGVSESYLGVVALSELLAVIADDGEIKRQIFFENVRDFQGDNPVNGEIARSLATQEGRDRFAVLNNGITLVARELKPTGDRFEVSDYQIVNGCQTSHVLFNTRHDLPPDMQVPLKVIATADEDVIGAIATATNRQTTVSSEDLLALERFQKRLEPYFGSFDDKQRLYYERRSKQFATSPGIEKVRIITKQLALRAFGGMFLDEAHRAARYYAVLKAQIGTTIFNDNHKLDPYYTASFAHYKLEYLFRNGLLPVTYKPARYHLLLGYRVLVGGWEMPAFTANKIQQYVAPINQSLWDDKRAQQYFTEATQVINAALEPGEVLDGDAVKVQAFTDRVLTALRIRK